ncbi:hypothetical protein [Rubripirellula reticaptiva]|nr:hypothetical protein [Rubripirellula reticaptiva]
MVSHSPIIAVTQMRLVTDGAEYAAKNATIGGTKVQSIPAFA